MNNTPSEMINALENWSNSFDLNDIVDCQYLLLFIKQLIIDANNGAIQDDDFLLEKINKILYNINEVDLINNHERQRFGDQFNDWFHLTSTQKKVIPLKTYHDFIIPNRTKTGRYKEGHY